MTGRSLVRRLLSQPHARLRWRLRVPLAARPVLEAVADLVAGSGEALAFRLDAEMDADMSLVQAVALHAEAAEAETAACLNALVGAGLVLLSDEGELRLALPERRPSSASPRKTESNRANAGYSMGPRPRGLSDEEWNARKAEKRRQVDAERGQRSMVLPLAGGQGREVGQSHGEASPESQEEVVSEATAVVMVASGSLSPQSQAAAEESEDIDFESQQQLGRDAREGGFRLASAKPNPEATVALDPGVSVELLALRVGDALGVQGNRGREPAALVAEWLAMPGMTEARILEIAGRRRKQVDRRRGEPGWAPIGSVDYIDAAVREAAGMPPRAQQAVQAAPRAVLPPELERDWMGEADRLVLSGALKVAGAGDAPALSRTILRMTRTYPRVLGVFLEARPDLAAAVEALKRRAVA